MALIVRPCVVVPLEGDDVALRFEELGATRGMARTDRCLWSRAAALIPAETVRGRRVLELGAGATGALGLAAKVRRAAQVVVTDLAVALPALEANVRRNARVAPGVQCRELDWSEALPAWACGRFDLIVAADCIYGDSGGTFFDKTLKALLDANDRATALVFNQSNRALFLWYRKLTRDDSEYDIAPLLPVAEESSCGSLRCFRVRRRR